MKCYAIHIMQSEFNKVMNNDNVVKIIKQNDGVPTAMSKNPKLYCSSILFKNEKLRNSAFVILSIIGIKAVSDSEPAVVDTKLVPKSWLN